jgi:hypothetical protein
MLGTFGTDDGNDRLWMALWGPTGEVPDSLVVNLGVDPGDDMVIPNPVAEGQWAHLALTFDYNLDAYTLYANGTEISNSHAARTAPTHPLSFGGIDARWWPYENYFSGLFDEVAVYDRVLAPHEVAAIYQAGSAGVCKYDQITILPHVFFGSGWQTVLSLTNLGSLEAADVEIRVYDDLGGRVHQEDIVLAPMETRRFTLSNSPMQLTSGYVVVEQSGAVVISARYEGRKESGEITESVAVIPTEGLTIHDGFVVDVVCDENRNTGIALVPQSVEDIDSGRVLAVLYDDEGNRIGDKEIAIGKHYSRFVSEIFSELTKPFSGYLLINHGGNNDKVQALGMLLEYRAAEWEFTSLPIHPWDSDQ